MGKAGSADLASVRTVGAVRDEVDAHLALGSLDGRVRLAGRHGVALGEELKVVDERLHALLHGGTRRRHELVVVHLDLARGHLVEALLDDAQRLAELLDAAEVSVVAVAVLADGHVELHLVVGVVRRHLADVPGDTRATQHDAGEAVVERLLCGDLADADGAALPDTVARHHLLDLVDARAKLRRPLVDVVQQAGRQVVRHTAGAHVGGVQTRTRHALVELHELLTLLERPQEGRQTTDVHDVREHRHAVVEDARDLAKHGADPLGALGHLDVEQLLDGARVAQLVGHHRNVVESVKVRQRLRVRLILDQLLRASVQETNVGLQQQKFKASAWSNVIARSLPGGIALTSVRRISSPLSSRIRRNTPWAAGCWGPKLTLLDGVGGGGGRDGHRLVGRLGGERAAHGGREQTRRRGCAGSVQLRSRSDGAEEGGRHDDVDDCVCRLGRRRGVAGGAVRACRCNQRVLRCCCPETHG
ncbi:hypothetical protein L1887_50200 [Cichorium endivia]|nr:hypothetical protein L1887_50200 [Cichorium endivia]